MIRFYTVAEIAKTLNLHPRTIRRKIKAGEIFATKIGNGKKSAVRIHEGELERLIMKGYKNITKNE